MPDPSMFGAVPLIPDSARRDAPLAAANDEENAASRYRALVDALADGFCVLEIIFDVSGAAIDHRFLEVNRAFEQQTGASHVVGRRATEVFPGLEKSWFEVYGQVAKTGTPIRLTREAKAIGRVFDVQAFRVDDPALHHVGVLFSDITTRVRQDEALRMSRQMLVTVIDHMPAAVCVIRGSDLRLELVNAAYQAIAPGMAMVGRTLEELWPDAGNDFPAICRKVLATGEPYQVIDDLNMIRRSADGELEAAYFSWSLHRIALPADEGWGLLNTAWETTQRKQIEEAAVASELRYRYLVEQVPDGIFVADGQGHYTDVNPAGCAMLGMTREEVLSCSIADVTLPEEHPRIPVEVARFDNGAIARSEWKFRRKDGSIFIGEVTGRRNSEGNLQAVLRDITETKKVEEALRESEQRFRLMVDDLPLIVWVHDAEGRLVFVNQTYCQYFGISRDQAYGDQWRVLTHPDDGDSYAGQFFTCLKERRSFHARVRVKRGDGAWRWMESWGRPRFAGHVFLGIVGTSADVSARVDAEGALKAADRRKDEFLALLAHELRNPLAPLRNGLELLRLGKNNEDMAERARAMMGRQVTHMVRLIDDLLDVSRIARGKLELRREAVELTDIVKSAIETSTPVMEAGRHELQVHIPPGPIPLEADPVRLAQVVSNLLNNAARYTPPGGHIVLSAQRLAGEVQVTVEDDGVGIPADMLEQVFEPFTQVETRARQAHGGLGLGLSLSRSLVELHGGTITAHSAGEGHGSRFTVRLPLVPTSADDSRIERSKSTSSVEKRLVLVVDDNRDAADSLAALLGLMGHDVRVAYDGPTALSTEDAYRPDVVLLDLGMPAMDGYEVARRLRSTARTPAPALVALTGFGQDSDRARSREAGFDEHLVKPVDPQNLEQLLAALRPRRPPVAPPPASI